MTIDEAIEILTNERKDHHSFPADIIGQAEQLGIEALEFRLRWEQQEGEDDFLLLPGETKD